jgi:hypothetical protein
VLGAQVDPVLGAVQPEADSPVGLAAVEVVEVDEFYAAQLRELVAAAGGVIPSAREVARLLSVGQDRARRLVDMLNAERAGAVSL